MNGLFKAWVAAALPLILNVGAMRCAAATINVIDQKQPTIDGWIAKESRCRQQVFVKFKSEWDYLTRIEATSVTESSPQKPKAHNPPSSPSVAENRWNAIAADELSAAASSDSSAGAAAALPATQNAIPAIVRAPGDGSQTLAALALVAFYATLKRKSLMHSKKSG